MPSASLKAWGRGRRRFLAGPALGLGPGSLTLKPGFSTDRGAVGLANERRGAGRGRRPLGEVGAASGPAGAAAPGGLRRSFSPALDAPEGRA